MNSMSHRRYLVVGLSMILVGTLVGARWLGADAPKARVDALVEVSRHSFDLEVLARGTLRPARVAPIKSHISSNQAQLIELLPDGTRVNRGLVVARFDNKPFLDKLQSAEQDLADARASHLAAQKGLDLRLEEDSGRIEAAQRAFEIAKIKAEDLREGSGKLKRQQLAQKLEQHSRAREIAAGELDDFDFLLGEGHVSQRERDKVADKLRSAEETLALTKAEMTNFDQYEWPRTLREAELLLDASRADLERVRRTAGLERQRWENEVEKDRRLVSIAERRLENARLDVANCEVVAPLDGVLLHAELPRPEGRRKIQVGDSIWFGQTFMEIPDTSAMEVDVEVREIDVGKLTAGMTSLVELDAMPGRLFGGTLQSIDSVAQSTDSSSMTQSFRARISLEEPATQMHVGMSASATIRYRRIVDALAVPVSAVAYVEGEAVVAVPGEEKHRAVEIGATGREWIEVRAGLRDGDQILTNGMTEGDLL